MTPAERAALDEVFCWEESEIPFGAPSIVGWDPALQATLARIVLAGETQAALDVWEAIEAEREERRRLVGGAS